ncbi:MAG: cation diffusion facilitator family transporter [Candidatus Devosia phytovorans]|uniref:Cation diffusion facilitator family transporter n=1 Tax=Candidatus Devosia phytovorans TaxID=3121372 RepID=A0AAJ6AYK9_9HYPH|nr:cation diffusion facilitator family transporter [Devosia sp.]WEK03695.1 MAG: cation diffusion facilitator family transporter [Devosia sp.]
MTSGRNSAGAAVGHEHAGHEHDDHDHHEHEPHEHDHAGRDHAGHDHSGHDHAGHSHAPTVSAGNERVVLIGFLLTAGFMFAEVIAGVLSGSLALIADAGHMLTDAAALLLAWAAFRFGRRASDTKRTFGYMRLEVVAGLINAVTLFILVGWIIHEAIQRFMTPHEVLAGPMFVVAVLGLVINVAVFIVLSRGDKEHVNIRGAMVHVLGDLLGSVAAIVAAITIWLTGWMPIDPILSVLVSLLVLRSAWKLFRGSLHILMEGTPGNVVVEDLSQALVAKVPGLKAVRHIHVWSITSGKPVATLEVVLDQGANAPAVTQGVKAALRADYAITHSTVEIVWDEKAPNCALAPEAIP